MGFTAYQAPVAAGPAPAPKSFTPYAPEAALPSAHPVADFARNVYSSIAKPPLQMLGNIGDVGIHAFPQAPQDVSTDFPIGFGAKVHIDDPYATAAANPDKSFRPALDAARTAAGQGAQTVALGLGPVTGGAAFMGGSALEQNKPFLPTFQGDNVVDKATNLFTDNVLGSAATGAAFGKAGELATRAAGGVIAGVGTGLKTFGGGANALYDSAQRNIEKILAPTTKVNKLETQKLAPQAARIGLPISLTRKSLLSKLHDSADTADTAITDVWSSLPHGSTVNVNPILENLTAEMNKLKIKGANGDVIPTEQQSYFNQLENKANELKSIAGPTGQGDAAAVRAYRQSLDSAVKTNKLASFSYSPTDTANLAGTKLAANSTREQIAKQLPGVGPANKQFHFFNGLADILDATITRKTGQGTPLGEKLAEGAGGAAGAITHGLTGGIEYAVLAKIASKVVQSTAWNTASAAAKKSLADAIAAHDAGALGTVLKTGFQYAGTGLEHVGNFIKGVPAGLKSLPNEPIPGTTPAELRRMQPGLSTFDITKLHPEDHNLLTVGYEAYKNGTALSHEDELALTRLLDHIGIRTSQRMPDIVKQMKSVLDGNRAFRGTDLRNLTGPIPRKSPPPATAQLPQEPASPINTSSPDASTNMNISKAVEDHITSAKQVLDSVPASDLSAMGGAPALMRQLQANIVMGLKASGSPEVSQAISRLDPLNFPTFDEFITAVRNITNGGKAQ